MNSARRTVRRTAALASAGLLLGLLVAPAPAAADHVRVSITPTTPGNTAVRFAQSVTVDGTAPEGPVTSARLVGLTSDGERYEPYTGRLDQPDQPLPPLGGGARPDFLRASGGRLEGRITLDCVFQDPGQLDPAAGEACGLPRRDTLRVLLEVVVGGETVRSGALPVDYARPRLASSSVVAPDRVVLRFSEPVRQPEGQRELPGDHTVEGATVLRVEPGPDTGCVGADGAPATGCDRTLVLSSRLDEDAEPAVGYAPFGGGELPRRAVTDLASNAFVGATELTAGDLVRPTAPRLDSVGGAAVPASGRVVGRQATLPVALSGVRGTHAALVEVQGLGEVAADADRRATVSLPQDGTYLLRAVAEDPSRNRSTDTGKAAPRADGSPSTATYVLDTAVPVLDRVVRRSDTAVEALFTETVTGPDRPGDWRVGGRTPTAVSGTGSTRTLELAGAAPGAEVVYAPKPAPGYADEAGNAVAASTRALDGIGLPVLETPAGRNVTNVARALVAGTARTGSVVRLFADRGDDGTPDGEPLQSQALTGGATRFSFPVDLVEGENDLVVRADDGTASGPRSPVAAVPELVLDTAPPALTVSSPAPGTVLPGDTDVPVDLAYSDANPAAAPVRVEQSLDGGATFSLLTAGTASDPYVWRTPATSTERALLRLTGRDAAGNVRVAETGVLVVDAVRPQLSATTVDARTVLVRLSEPVTGSSSALDWRVRGERVSAASESTEGGVVVVRLTTGPGVVLGPDEEPAVLYEPGLLSTPYRDRAQQTVRDRLVTALDRVRPAVPAVTTPASPVLTRETTQQVTGTGQPGGRVELLDPADARAAGPVDVGPDGRWAVDAPLVRDAANDLRARAVDRNGNRSTTAAPVARIEQDATDPAVTVTEPVSGSQLAPGSRVTVRWTSADRNLVERATTVQASTDGGRTFTLLAEQQPASGSLVWTVPSTTTSRALLVVTTPDRAGRTGRGTASPLGIGVAAETPAPGASSPSSSPSASASPAPTAVVPPGPPPPPGTAKPLAPLGLTVPAGSITPGQPARVVVTGRPGTQVELLAYTRPSTTYRQVRTGVLDSSGRAAFAVTPGGNTRLFARAAGRPEADSRSAVVTVRTALSLTVVRNARRDYTFQGRILPRRAGQLVTLYRVTADGTRVIATQIRTDSSGTYRMRRQFTGSGRFGFLTRTGQTLTNAAGESNEGRARPTDVF